MKKLLTEWHKYLKEQTEIQDYAYVQGLTAKLGRGGPTFTYGQEPDKYTKSREWLKQASEEFFGGVKSDLEGRTVSSEDYYPELEDPGPHDMLPSMSNRDFVEAQRAAEMDAFLNRDDFGRMGGIEKEVAQGEELLKYLHPGSQQYLNTKNRLEKYIPVAKEDKARRLQTRVGYPAKGKQTHSKW